MKVLISGGEKTVNIVNAISDKFRSSGVDFITVPFIEEIPDVFAKGEYFDRAIIVEQSWTHDNESTDESSVRSRVNDFANDMYARGISNSLFVFLSQTQEMATIISEEILDIRHDSILLVKSPKYTVNFFAMMITYEVADFPEEYLFVESSIEPELSDDASQFYNSIPEMSDSDFDTNFGNENANKLPIDEGQDSFEGQYTEDSAPPAEGEAFDSVDFQFDGEEQLDRQGFDSVDDAPADDLNSSDSGATDSDFSDPEFSDPEFSDPEFSEAAGEDIFDSPDDFQDDTGEPVADDQSMPEGQFDSPDDFQYDDAQGFENQGDLPENQDVRTSGEIPDYSGPDTGFNAPLDNQFDDNGQSYEEPPYEEPPYEEPSYEEPPYEEPPYEEPQYDNGYPEQTNQEQYQDPGDMFSDNDYAETQEAEPEIEQDRPVNRVGLSNEQIKASFEAFANRGNSIVVTGCGGCGTSTIAMNLANTICNMGFSVLLVDLDTEMKAQSYISKEQFDSVDPDSASVMSAINSNSGSNAYLSIVRQGFHLLTMGMASDSRKVEEAFKKDKLSRFTNIAKTNHNFVIYDIPFETATGYLDAITLSADNLVLVIDASNWGITKTMISACNIADDDMQEILFDRAQIVFNKFRGIRKVMGKKVKKPKEILDTMDKKVVELLGEDPGYHFSEMHVSGVIGDDPAFEAGWYNNAQYSDTKKGSEVFINLLKHIVLHI